MKKIFLILFIILFLTSCFGGEKENKLIKDNVIESNIVGKENNINFNGNNLKENYFCKDLLIKNNIIQNFNKKVQNIYFNYNKIKEVFNGKDNEDIKELKKELYTIEGFALKKCSIIKDRYSKELCDIYISGDYNKLDNFKFEGGETKEEALLLFKSLNERKILKGVEEKVIFPILNWNNLGKKVKFDFINDENTFRVDYYVYYKVNGKNKFFNELNKQFLNKCKILNNEN